VTDVRDACQDASKVIMSRLSGHCVNIILPSLLAGLEEKQWRTKKGSIELLGAMAFCAPKQLATSLPTIIPELTAVLTDSQFVLVACPLVTPTCRADARIRRRCAFPLPLRLSPSSTQVRQAANTSLKRFGDVIHNPEIKALVPTLLKALVDPTGKTNAALTHLLNTAFSHFIDAPSLALVRRSLPGICALPLVPLMPDLALAGLPSSGHADHRARHARAQRPEQAQVGSNSGQPVVADGPEGLYALLSVPLFAHDRLERDLTDVALACSNPVTTFMPLVHIVLVDPVPEARGTAAKALGTLVERLGEDCFPELVESLLQTLKSDTSGVDRQVRHASSPACAFRN
jgi:hypothetical protein